MSGLSRLRHQTRLAADAFLGTAKAREGHDRATAWPPDIEACLRSIDERWPRLRADGEDEPIFLLAAGWRSGSTLLQRMLLANSGTMIWGEPYARADIVGSMMQQFLAFTKDWPADGAFLHHADAGLEQQWVANSYPEMRCFVDAHRAYFRQLFEAPAHALNRPRWGFKEVRLGIDHALYLRWLFPKAKFVLSFRNPYHAYASYRSLGRAWYRRWPGEPVFTPFAFGRMWKELVDDYLANHGKVDGLVVRYEDLDDSKTRQALQDYLGQPVGRPEDVGRVSGTRNPVSKRSIPKLEYLLLKKAVASTSDRLGYHGL